MAAFRPGDRFEHVRRASLGDARGRLGFEDSAYPQADYLRAARAAAETNQARDVLATEALQGAAIAERVQELRIAALPRWRRTRGDLPAPWSAGSRSDARRVGSECVRKCRSGWVPNPQTKHYTEPTNKSRR